MPDVQPDRIDGVTAQYTSLPIRVYHLPFFAWTRMPNFVLRVRDPCAPLLIIRLRNCDIKKSFGPPDVSATRLLDTGGWVYSVRGAFNG